MACSLGVESAWDHRKPYRASREVIRRRAGQPPVVRERAELGNRRLRRRWMRLDVRAKRPTISSVAVARELAGWCWSLAVMGDNAATAATSCLSPDEQPARAGDGRQLRGATRGTAMGNRARCDHQVR